MQSHILAVLIELREQAWNLASSIRPSAEAVAQQYAAKNAETTAPDVPATGGAINVQA